MTDLLILLIQTLASTFRNRGALILENLLLRQQLQVALRPKRRLRPRRRDRLFWIFARRPAPRLAPVPPLRPAGDSHPVASTWLALVLAVEIADPEPLQAGMKRSRRVVRRGRWGGPHS